MQNFYFVAEQNSFKTAPHKWSREQENDVNPTAFGYENKENAINSASVVGSQYVPIESTTEETSTPESEEQKTQQKDGEGEKQMGNGSDFVYQKSGYCE